MTPFFHFLLKFPLTHDSCQVFSLSLILRLPSKKIDNLDKKVKYHSMKINFVILLAALLFAISEKLMAASSQVLRFSVSTSWGMPFGQFENEEITGGLIYDLALAISDKNKLRAQFVLLPRNRIDAGAQNNEFDIRCYVAPEWVTDKNSYLWSDPLFEISDIVVGHINIPPIKKLADLNGKKIGTVLGYIYPALEKGIKSGSIEREDAENQKAVLQKLAHARTNYAISNSLSYVYFFKTSENRVQLAKWKKKISSTNFHCAVLKKSHLKTRELITSIRELKKNGSIERILSKYR